MKQFYKYLIASASILLFSCQFALAQSDGVKLAERPVEVNVDFNEPVIGFEISDVIIEGGTLRNEIIEKDDGKFQLLVDVPEGEGELYIEIQAAAVKDLAQNPSKREDHVKSYDRLPPKPVISVENSLVAADIVPVSIDFGEAIKGFDITDIILSSGYIENFTEAGEGLYTVDIAGMDENSPLSVRIAENSCEDEAENKNRDAVIDIDVPDLMNSFVSAEQSKKEDSGKKQPVNDLMLETAFSVFPNPSNGQFKVNYRSNRSFDEANISIYDLNGRMLEMSEFTVEGNNFVRSFDISSYSDGVYIVQLRTAQGVETQRLVKQQ